MTPVLFIHCTRHEPFVAWIMARIKQYETRTRNTLKKLLDVWLGERVLIAETGSGDPLVRCSAVIDEIVSVTTPEEWERYRQVSYIPFGSNYDWKSGTKVKYLYHLSDVRPVEPFRLSRSCRRHGRVWAEFYG